MVPTNQPTIGHLTNQLFHGYIQSLIGPWDLIVLESISDPKISVGPSSAAPRGAFLHRHAAGKRGPILWCVLVGNLDHPFSGVMKSTMKLMELRGGTLSAVRAFRRGLHVHSMTFGKKMFNHQKNRVFAGWNISKLQGFYKAHLVGKPNPGTLWVGPKPPRWWKICCSWKLDNSNSRWIDDVLLWMCTTLNIYIYIYSLYTFHV